MHLRYPDVKARHLVVERQPEGVRTKRLQRLGELLHRVLGLDVRPRLEELLGEHLVLAQHLGTKREKTVRVHPLAMKL